MSGLVIEILKRVKILYRVSTKKQYDKLKDDIPMQKKACHDFVEQHGWTIVDEVYEKGISGYKVSASKRDAIQQLKQSALNNEFDILLVYMFDRIGRIDDETPFVVEWIKHGIEVCSIQKGQQKMIICQLIKSIKVSRGYSLEIEFNASYRQFFGDEMCSNEVIKKENICRI